MLRQVVEELSVSQIIDATAPLLRNREAVDGLIWRLARRPQDGIHVAGDFWLIKIPATPQSSMITVLYTYDVNQVNIVAIKIV